MAEDCQHREKLRTKAAFESVSDVSDSGPAPPTQSGVRFGGRGRAFRSALPAYITHTSEAALGYFTSRSHHIITNVLMNAWALVENKTSAQVV